MITTAEKMRKKYLHLNETSFPVFKIHEDPRFTKIGKFLSHTGLDELPQLINVVRGEMSLVGPRPLPVDEAHAIPDKYRRRFSVLPGITSLWVIKGSHKLTFEKWMEYDIEYIRSSSFFKDILILLFTVITICKLLFKKLLRYK
jgi:lipopolysaccharide/colanic/teichoic acid biosynthesis glycosyltransferase